MKANYGLKFFYLVEDEKPFFTQWFTNAKNVTIFGHRNSDVDNDHGVSCFAKYSQDGNKD